MNIHLLKDDEGGVLNFPSFPTLHKKTCFVRGDYLYVFIDKEFTKYKKHYFDSATIEVDEVETVNS